MARRKTPRVHDYDAVLEFIKQHKRETDGAPPTIRQIMQACNISSKSVACYIIKVLIKDGKLYKRNQRICVTGGEWVHKNLGLPFVGLSIRAAVPETRTVFVPVPMEGAMRR